VLYLLVVEVEQRLLLHLLLLKLSLRLRQALCQLAVALAHRIPLRPLSLKMSLQLRHVLCLLRMPLGEDRCQVFSILSLPLPHGCEHGAAD